MPSFSMPRPEQPAKIRLRRADPRSDSADSRAVWEWRNDPATRAMSRNSEVISWEAHSAWYERVAVAPDRVLLIAEFECEAIGMVRFDMHVADAAEISINLAPAARGRRLARPLIEAAKDYGFAVLDLQRIDAAIKPENAVSMRVFEAAGFKYLELRDSLLAYELLR